MTSSASKLPLRAAIWRAAILLLLAVVPGKLTADEIPARALTPPAYPTEVYVGLFDVEVFEIDERQETFVIEADLRAEWLDPRLAFGSFAATDDYLPPHAYEEEAATELLKTIWWPNFELVDGRGSRDRMHLSVEIYPDGTVTYYERFTAKIKQGLDLEPFPFDAHDISFAFGPFSADSTSVVFLPIADMGSPIEWEPTEWIIDSPELLVLSGFQCSESGEPCSSNDECTNGETCESGWASAQVRMSISRSPQHYLWKIILPLTLIVLASSAVFWLDLERYPDPGDRLGISFTGVLSVVAFDFVSSGSLPKLWYSTVLDKVLVMAYVFLAINIALNVITTRLSKARPVACRRSDLVGRWVFPLAFLVGLWVLIP